MLIPEGYVLGYFGYRSDTSYVYRLDAYVFIDPGNTDVSLCRCPSDLLGNQVCNWECNTQACQFDGLDCAIESIDNC